VPRKSPGKKSVTTQLSEDTHSLLKRWAEENYWSVSKAVEVLVERGLANYKNSDVSTSPKKRSPL
jgi:hypothetical protein